VSNKTIDLNADVGEGVNNETQLMPFLSSCSIACGGHAGDESTMTSVVQLAKKHQVKIGAHPSFPDKANFGRLKMDISSDDLLVSLKTQVNSLLKVLENENRSLHHIKPHGALYNLANTDNAYAEVIVDLMNHFDGTKLYAPYGSLIAKKAEDANITVFFEAFADRNYNDDLTLVSRSKPNALIEDAEQMSEHVLNMILHHHVKTINGTEKNIKADTMCMHGDQPQAAQHLKILTERLIKKGIQIL
jgi:UPF0271 protein